jgi:integrase
LPSLDLAIAEAKSVGRQLAGGDFGTVELSAADRVSADRALTILKPLGVPLELCASEYVDARTRLGKVSLSQAVDSYLKRHPANLVSKKVEAVMEEMLELKKNDGLSAGYLRHLRYDLEKFATRFHSNIDMVTGPEIDKWLRGLGVSPRTRNNLRNSVQTLFAFAKSQKYLPKDHDEIDGVTRAKDGAGEIEIFTPKEMVEILTHADARVIPFLTLGAFAGIRHAEIQRLDWNDIHFDAGIIEIRAAKAKTASRRTLPILDNLRAWLLRHRQEAGPVCVYLNMASEIESLVRGINEARRAVWAQAKGASGEKLKQAEKQARQALAKAKAERGKPKHRGDVPPGAETAKIEGWPAFAWKHNALRHSFISYRVADIQNVAQVALEAGNSPQMIFKHYRELVRPAEAKAWFGIAPEKEKCEY